jgi:dsRNA-specific ribonuclease
MFDVGSSGGFYTEKSPKLMLQEWCTRQKRPKPKFKAVAQEPDKGGGFRSAGSGVNLLLMASC